MSAHQSPDDCNLDMESDCDSTAVCKAGYTSSGVTDGTCAACALGFYKTSTGAGTCNSCGSGKTTAETGSTSASSCGGLFGSAEPETREIAKRSKQSRLSFFEPYVWFQRL